MFYLVFTVLGKKVAILKSSYYYMDIISLQNFMEKVIYEFFVLFMCKSFKLIIYTRIIVQYRIFLHQRVCIEFCGELHLRTTVYK